MESLKEAVEEGLTRAVGVSNYSKEQVRKVDEVGCIKHVVWY